MPKKKTQPVVKVYQSDSALSEDEVSGDEHSKEEEVVEEDDGFNVDEEAEEDDQSSENSEDDDEPEDDDHDGDDSEDGDDEAQEDSDGDGPQSGWADAMAKVLNTGKTKEASSLFLSKARMDSEWKRKSTDDQDKDSGEPEQKKPRPQSALAKRLQRKEIESKCRSRPPSAAEPGSAEARMAEKQLSRLATRGVVQFFNAVRDHQKTLKTELSAVGGSVRKREKVMRQMADRQGFMETLEKNDKRPSKGIPLQSQEVKQEQEESSWNILREDFMMGAKMRDWDKESDGE
jgi:hypothetical protein